MTRPYGSAWQPEEPLALRLMRWLSWSFRVFRIFRIPVYLHWSMLLILLYLIFNFGPRGFSLESLLWGLLTGLSLYGLVLLHELGHCLAGIKNQIRPTRITLYPMGGLAGLEDAMRHPWMEIEVALAGPLVNLLLLLATFLVQLLLPMLDIQLGYFWGSYLLWFFWTNLALSAFNLIPAFPMDGGRVLRGILALRMGEEKATRHTCHVSLVLSGIMLLIAMLYPGMNSLAGALLFWIALSNIFTCLSVLRQGGAVYSGEPEYAARARFQSFDPAAAVEDQRPGFFARWRERREERKAAQREKEALVVRAEVDRLLDKINAQGITALTDAERAFLKKQGRKKD